MITRKRDFDSRTEKAVLDFFIINEKMRPFLRKMLIDENREYTLSNFVQMKKNQNVIETDHNGLLVEMNINVSERKPEREEMFNLKNKACQEAFKEATENNQQLLKCFDNNLSIEIQSKQWNKVFKSVLHKCFRKVRIVKNEKKERKQSEHILRERIKLKKEARVVNIDEKTKLKIEERIKQIENEIGTEIEEENHEAILEAIHALGGNETSLNGAGRKQMWSLLKRKYPKISTAIPVGKKDRGGNLITNHEGLKRLYLGTYVHRLRKRKMKPNLEDLKSMKNNLFNLRLELSKSRKSEPWTMKDLEALNIKFFTS